MKKQMVQPYLSIIATTRNDGADANSRLRLFVDSLRAQAKTHELDCELIIVEWNPPQERARLNEILQPTLQSDACKLRIIEVPPDVHRSFDNSEAIPLFQMIAKNVGIRRALGKFVLATNIDILFSNELIEFFASDKLCADRMYRIDRYDVPFNIPEDLSVDERLEWCHRNPIRLYRYLETVDVVDGIIPPPKTAKSTALQRTIDQLTGREKPLHTNACGDFALMSAEYWEKVKGYPEFPLRAMKLDGLLCYAAHYAGARQAILKDPLRIYHLAHPTRTDGAVIALSNRQADSSSLQIPLSQYKAWTKQMRQFRRPIIFNNLGWGLPDKDLNETIID
jgi:hypothetical protein